MRIFLAFLTFFFANVAVLGQEKAEVQIGLSDEVVEISSSFDGTDIIIFGSIEGGDRDELKAGRYDLVVVLVGPSEFTTVRRREKKLGIWVNGSSVRFSDVPSSYSIATTKPLDQISDSSDKKILQIGLKNINIVPDPQSSAIAEVETFRESLSRLKVSQKLYLERIGGIEFLTPTLFKARLAVPANVPIGKHTARAFLFKDGKFENSRFTELRVKKVGFEQFTYDLAHSNGLLYGIIAVLIAIATGWLASVIFRKD